MDNPDYQRIAQAIEYLEDHAANQPTLGEVAAQVGLSQYHFQRLFKTWAGVSPKRFLQYLTIENAKRRLRESASVLDAALDVGLSGPGRLHDLFVSVEALTPGEYKHYGRELVLKHAFLPTPFGECLIAVSNKGVCSLAFVEPENRQEALAKLHDNWQEARLTEDPQRCATIVEQIFTPTTLPGQTPLKVLLKGTNFQLKVWAALLKIPEGSVVSYATLANAIDHHGAHRAVGTAAGQNPIAYLIPCHRVLRADGRIGGYHWGITRKRAILAREAALNH